MSDRDYDAFATRDLSDRDFVYVSVDGIHFNVRLGDDRLSTLAMISVRSDANNELIACEAVHR